MTDLQTSLIVIGGAIVVGVMAFNKWQEHKAKKSVERAFSTGQDDVLMTSSAAASFDEQRQEPIFSASHGNSSVAQHEVQHQPADFQDGDSQTYSSAFLEAVPKELPVDSLVDCIIPLALDGPVRGEKIILPLQNLRHVGSKPVHFIGQREDGGWEPIAHGVVYTALQAGVQLANRSSALNELEYSELITRLRQIADDIGAEADIPDMTTVMVSSRAMHQFVTEYDAKLSVNIHSNGAPWAISTLLSALERHGFDLRPDGNLVMADGEGGVLYSLSTNVTLAADTTSILTLLLDVPCVAQSRDGFGSMIACAKMLASRLDGKVVDDGDLPLSDEAIGAIAQQVAAFYRDMESAEIPAGSNRALRLFS
ncbi:MAG: cell division protein ZipA C-terminal FtsZ-binding domain-containing protein [Burkholderiaceae bacterium]